MNQNTKPNNVDLPTTGKLIKSTLIAIAIAAVLLITVILPAEYGIDPTNIGSMLGLKRMGEIKVSLEDEAIADRQMEMMQDQPANAAETGEKQSTASKNEQQMSISLEPDQGKEIKLAMREGAEVTFKWWTDGGEARFDSHADSKPLEIKYHNYEKGAKQQDAGVLTAAFDGNHGWFWRNRTGQPMTVTLVVDGDYTDIHMPK